MKITKKLLNETKMPDTPTARKVLAKMLEEDDDTQVYKKPWVGLTDDEYFGLQMKIKTPMVSVQDYIDAMRMVEAKLKEKNA